MSSLSTRMKFAEEDSGSVFLSRSSIYYTAYTTDVVYLSIFNPDQYLERNLISLYAPDSTTHCGSGEAISLNSMVPCALLALDCVAYAMALPSMRSIGERNCSAELL